MKEEEEPERDGRAVAPLFWFVTVHVFLSDIDGFPTKSLFQTQDSTFSLLFLLNTLLKWLLLICKQIKNGLMVGESFIILSSFFVLSNLFAPASIRGIAKSLSNYIRLPL